MKISKLLLTSIILSIFANTYIWAQGTYYNTVESQVANGLDCMPLKQALHDLIDNHTVRDYFADLTPFICTYDVDANGIIIDRYKGTSYSCSGNSLPSAMNREHVLPKSWWGGSTSVTQYSDFHNLFPSDAVTNSDKSAYPLGLVSTSINGNYPYTSFPMTNIGLDGQPCTNINNGTTFDDFVFEPDNGYKGDFARVFLYMAVRYQDEIINQNWKNVNSQTASVFSNDMLTIYEPCLLTMLLQWHNQDAPSALEIARNNAIALSTHQGNRNPFIDHPEYASLIWESPCATTTACAVEQLNACDFTSVPVTTNTGTQPTWLCNADGSYTINAYTAGNNASEQWLIYGPVNLSNATLANLVIDIDENYTGPDLEFLWNATSNNPASPNWNLVTTAGNADVFGLNINYAAATGNPSVYIGIRYTATGASGGTHSFILSNISLETDNCCASVDLNLSFDGFPNQTSWSIVDANNMVVASSNSYNGQPSYSTLTESTCLPDGCYTLQMNDALNNGMCPFQSSAVGVSTFITPGTLISPGSIVGTLSLVATPGLCGNYNLTDANGTVLVSGGGAFGASQSQNFCINNGLAPKLEQLKTNQILTVSPSLAREFVQISYQSHAFELATLLVTDINGKVYLMEEHIQAEQKLNISNLPKGMYLVHSHSQTGNVTQKFIKQ